MTAEETARRFAGSRPGYQLISYREVALPLFKVDLELLIQERKAISPIQEFVLRAVERGVRRIDELAGFLGVDEGVVRRTAADLLTSDELVLAPSPDGRQNVLHVTSKGKRSAKEAEAVQAAEVSLPVWIDGLTREVLSVTAKGHQWFPAGRSAERGLVEVAAFPRRRPGLEAIPLESVQRVIRRESAGRRAPREVIGITGMGRAWRFAREGVALAYQAPGEDDPIVSLVVEGELSEAHDAAFSRSMARSTLQIVPRDWQAAHAALSKRLPVDASSGVDDTGEGERLEQEKDALQQEDRELRAAAEQASEEQLQALREQLARSEEKQKALQAALDSISVRQVPVYQHRDYLDRAFREARRRILIVSPWIRYEVVTDEFVSRLRRVLDRKVQIWIGFGIVKSGGYRAGNKGEADRAAEKKLERLTLDYPGLFRMTRLGDTHAKVLVCDSRFSILTSFNWLSFRGDDRLEFRDERGYYVGLATQVDELFESYRARFDGPPEG